MPDSQSSEPGFESPFATVSKIGYFRSLNWRPSWLSCINEYLAIDSGGNVSDLALARNFCVARMLPGEAELVSEWTGLPGEENSVKRFERSNGLDTALYKNYLYLLFILLSEIFNLPLRIAGRRHPAVWLPDNVAKCIFYIEIVWACTRCYIVE